MKRRDFTLQATLVAAGLFTGPALLARTQSSSVLLEEEEKLVKEFIQMTTESGQLEHFAAWTNSLRPASIIERGEGVLKYRTAQGATFRLERRAGALRVTCS